MEITETFIESFTIKAFINSYEYYLRSLTKKTPFSQVQFDEQQVGTDESKYVTAHDSREAVACLIGYLLDQYYQEMHGKAISA